jgi:hypothetical protein
VGPDLSAELDHLLSTTTHEPMHFERDPFLIDPVASSSSTMPEPPILEVDPFSYLHTGYNPPGAQTQLSVAPPQPVVQVVESPTEKLFRL